MSADRGHPNAECFRTGEFPAGRVWRPVISAVVLPDRFLDDPPQLDGAGACGEAASGLGVERDEPAQPVHVEQPLPTADIPDISAPPLDPPPAMCELNACVGPAIRDEAELGAARDVQDMYLGLRLRLLWPRRNADRDHAVVAEGHGVDSPGEREILRLLAAAEIPDLDVMVVTAGDRYLPAVTAEGCCCTESPEHLALSGDLPDRHPVVVVGKEPPVVRAEDPTVSNAAAVMEP